MRAFRSSLATYLVCCAVLASSFISFGSSVAVAQTSKAETLLLRDLKSAIKTLPNQIRIYHYFNAQDGWWELATPAGRIDYINRYLEDVTSRFWDLTNGVADDAYARKNLAAGYGLYMAIDPAISRNFGNTLIEFTLPAGTKYVRVVGATAVAKDTIKALVDEGVIVESEAAWVFPPFTYKAKDGTSRSTNGFYRDTFKNMSQVGHERFRRFINEFFVHQGISFIEYNFNTSLMGFCKQHSYSAFNYIGLPPAAGSNRAVLHPEYRGTPMISDLNFPDLSPDEIATGQRVRRFRDLIDQTVVYGKKGKMAPESLLAQFYTPAEIAALKLQTFSCQ